MTDQPKILRDAAEVVRLALAGGDLPAPPNPLRPTADPREQTPRSPTQLAARVAEQDAQIARQLAALDRMNAAREAEAARGDALAAEIMDLERRLAAAGSDRAAAIAAAVADVTASRDHWRDACVAARTQRDDLAELVARLRRDVRWQWLGLAAAVVLFGMFLVIASRW